MSNYFDRLTLLSSPLEDIKFNYGEYDQDYIFAYVLGIGI